MKVVPILTLEARIKRRLRRHLKTLGFVKDEQGRLTPPESSKSCIRSMHLAQKNERIEAESVFIEREWPLLRKYFADGREVTPEAISPRLELVSADTWQSRLFRLASLTWSVPVSQGYGRRMRFLVWDDSNEKLVGLMGLGDPVFNLRVRDEWIGWNVEDRRERLVDVLDAYVLGALPPYNMLLGGKLLATLIHTRELVDTFRTRYSKTQGIISGRKKRPELCLVTTTSALGKSSVYNRLALNGKAIFTPIGYTSGWGHFHIPDDLFALIREYLDGIGDEYAHNHRFGDGPNWKFRAVRKALSVIGMDPDLLRHGVAREVFVCPLARNAKAVLAGTAKRGNFAGLPSLEESASAAKERWVIPRAIRRPEFRLWKCDNILRLLQVVDEKEKSQAQVLV